MGCRPSRDSVEARELGERESVLGDFALADEGEQRLQLRALGILARGAVGEDAIQRDLLQLPLRGLVKRADAGRTRSAGRVCATKVSG